MIGCFVWDCDRGETTETKALNGCFLWLYNAGGLLLLLQEILQLIGGSPHYLQVFFTSQVVQDSFHQQYCRQISK